MQPSSLIFVLVVAIWAVYLLQYWIKRRDHLSTIRSVDRFSEAMRVLDDHRLGWVTAEPTPRSYSVAPTRAARPEATVTHAVAPPARTGASTARPTARPEVVSASRRRRRRGLTLLTTLTLLPAIALVVVLGPLPWWTVVAWSFLTVVAFAWLRRAVVAERTALRRACVEQRRASARRTERPVAAPHAESSADRTRPAAPAAPAPPAAPAAESAGHRTPVYDVVEERQADEPAAPAAQVSTEEAEPGTWQPTPVPRPMYTMKAKAERPEPTPAPAPGPAGDIPQVIEVEDGDLPAIAGWG